MIMWDFTLGGEDGICSMAVVGVIAIGVWLVRRSARNRERTR